jgi:phosphate transport system substrate-binding protein
VKKAHIGVIPGIKEFVSEYVSDRALGEEGYLADKGLIPPDDAERAKIRTEALAFKSVKL